MKECSKSVPRRLGSPLFTNRFFVGHGLDVGGRPDPLALYAHAFSRIESVRTWDREDGDGQFLEGVADESFDFVHSSHCLEHLADPAVALRNWVRVVRPGGHVIVIVPDEDLYEQGRFPSTFNSDHKWTFTIFKKQSWSPRSLNILDLIVGIGDEVEAVRLEKLDATYRYDLPRVDQTLSPVVESGIEFVLRRRPPAEVTSGGRLPAPTAAADRTTRLHFNQYRNDARTLKAGNVAQPPFLDDGPLES
jgi:SAM-dependent methyltransferase